MAEIRDVLTRPLDTQSRELRARAIRSYDNGWMDEALADGDLRRRMGRAARSTVEARFTERSMVERYETSFNQLAATRSARENLRRRAAAH